MDKLEMYRRMLLIRKSEERIEELFSYGKLRGTTHGSRGQEAVAVGLLSNIDCNKDYITGSHRSHGHYFALNPDPYPFFAELMGKESGLVGGRGGSQHIAYRNFITNGITGGMVPVAVGLAFAQKTLTNDSICICIFGDGAFNEGYVMEAMNLASAFNLPIIFAMENNYFAMSTAFSYSNKGNVKQRVEGLGLPYYHIKADDVVKVYEFCEEKVGEVRKERFPLFIEFETFRFSGHSKSDNREYIPRELDKHWEIHDPLLALEKCLDEKSVAKIHYEINNTIEEAIERASNDADPRIIRSKTI